MSFRLLPKSVSLNDLEVEQRNDRFLHSVETWFHLE